MASIGGILPIPEQTIVGTGSYIIPANRYGFISMSTTNGSSSAQSGYSGTGGIFGGAGNASGSSSANSNHQWVSAGDSITTANSAGSYSDININGVTVCTSSSTSSATMLGLATSVSSSRGKVGWSVALYRKPIGNLPEGAAEGEA